MRGFRYLLFLAAAVLATATASPVAADGSLKPGEILFTSAQIPSIPRTGFQYLLRDVGEQFVGRISASGNEVDVITEIAGASVAVADENHVYVAGWDKPNAMIQVWKVDVRDGDATLIVEMPFSDFGYAPGWDFPFPEAVAVEKSGKIVLLIAQQLHGSYSLPAHVLRVDPVLGSTQTPEVLAVLGACGYSPWFTQLKLANDGEIFVSCFFERYRVDAPVGGTPTVTSLAFQMSPRPFDYDRGTGELIHAPGDLYPTMFFRSDSNGSGYTLTPALQAPTGQTQRGSTTVLEPSGDFIQASGSYIQRVDQETGARTTVATAPFRVTDVEAVWPKCLNGLDDDGDGLVDYRADGSGDPDCLDGSDDREVKACGDGFDNDGDGLTDLADVSDCPNAQSDGEFTRCNNGLDDDGDGEADGYDTECFDAFDESEVPQCSDGIDNDGDSFVDLDDFLYCQYPTQNCESGNCPGELPACNNGWDDDGDGFTDWDGGPFGGEPDPQCNSAFTVYEDPTCHDGLDNDGDGKVDFKEDGTGDPDCDAPSGSGEVGVCDDGLDNDFDGLIDLADDGCTDAADPSENFECSDGVDNDGNGFIDFDSSFLSGIEINGSFELGEDPPTTWVSLPDGSTSVYGWVVSTEVDWVTGTWQPSEGSASIDLASYVPGAISQFLPTEVGQQYTVQFDLAGNPITGNWSPVKTLHASAAGTNENFTFDTTGFSTSNMGWRTETFTFTATDTSTELRFTAGAGSGAAGPALDNVVVTPVWLGADPGCDSPQDPIEATFECSDGIDNDGDGKIDYPADTNCSNAQDDSEGNVNIICATANATQTGVSWLLTIVGLLIVRSRKLERLWVD